MSIEIRNRVPENEGRAKHARIEINKKHIDFPKKTSSLSREDSTEITLYKNEFKSQLVSEFVLVITPKALRLLVTNSTKHQEIKDQIRKMLAEAGNKGLNIAYPLLVNQRSPNEEASDFVPFGKPSEKVLEKLFDVLDIEGFDIIIMPVASSNGNSFEWVKMATDVFKKRKPDYLNEYILSGLVPRTVTENVAISMANHYLENEIKSLSFDFASRKVPEGRMRAIIDGVGKQWGDIFVHGTNVPHFNWYGTWRKSVLPTYDLLISTYGFDSFGGVRLAMGGDVPEPNQIKDKIANKRYMLTDTYGTYNLEGLKKISTSHFFSCGCPTCKNTTPLDIYNTPHTVDGLYNLSNNLKIHRLFSTHNEMNQISGLIDKNKYFDHITNKKDATNEVSSILNSLK